MDGVEQKDKSKQHWEQEFHKLEKSQQQFLKRYDLILQERNSYKDRAYRLEAELQTLQPAADTAPPAASASRPAPPRSPRRRMCRTVSWGSMRWPWRR
jgi:chromosome segregation ATPase